MGRNEEEEEEEDTLLYTLHLLMDITVESHFLTGYARC